MLVSTVTPIINGAGRSSLADVCARRRAALHHRGAAGGVAR
jgi:hypothetical protein